MNRDDRNLIVQARSGDQEAFTRLVMNYKQYVYRTIYGMVANAYDAQDLAQETFIKAYQALPTLRDETTFPTWLARIAIHVSSDFLRKKQRQKELNERLFHHEKHEEHQQASTRWDLQDALLRLSEEQRTVLLLRTVQELHYEEIAQIMNIPIGTVRSRLYAAIKKLHELLQEGGDER